jgi:hypothetical protein
MLRSRATHRARSDCRVSLHREVRAEHVATLQAMPQIVHFGAQLNDFATAVAHLAGAMGRPLWLLTMLSPDWRWLLDRTDSAWYPTAKLYRQPSVVARVCDDLVSLARQG